MGKHAKPSRAVLIARTGACGGAVLALSAAGLIAPMSALADGTPPGEVVSTSQAEPEKKANPAKKANKANKANKEKAKKAQADEVKSHSVDPENGFEQSIEQDAENASHNINGLANLAGNNVQLIAQACNNFVPVNGVGGQVAGEALAGAAGAVAEGTGAGAENSKDCEQFGAQLEGDDGDDDAGGAGAGERNVNGLVNVSDNNVQVPVQACNNFVPVNGVGGQVAGEEVTGALGVLGNDTEVDSAGNSKDCDQASDQDDAEEAGVGDRNTNGLVNVSDNNVQVPLQGCNNYVPVNGVGGQVTGEEVTGALGLIAGDTRAESSSSKDCDQESGQEDDD